MNGLVRTYLPPLPRSVLTLQAGGLVNSFGNGVVLPFLLIYLHNVRGIGLGPAGLILATNAVASVVANPVFGTLVDRFGGKRMLATALAILAVGYAAYPLVHEAWQGFVVATVTGIGVGGFWPAQSTLLAGLTPSDLRPPAFAMQRVAMNLGIGLGALTGGVIASTDSPGTFTTLFLLNAASFVVYALVMAVFVPSPAVGGGGHPPGSSGSYRDVFRNRPFVTVIGLNTLFIFAGLAGFELLPVYAKNEAAVSETQIGIVFFVNTLVIVVAQLPVARLAQGRRRMPMFSLLGVLWAAAWLVVPLAATFAAETAMLTLTAAMVVFAFGQCLHGAVNAPLVVDLSEPRLLGRYMAVSALSWQVGFALGPAVGGYMLAITPSGVWIGAATLCVVGSALSMVVEGSIPERARRTPFQVSRSAVSGAPS